MQYTSHISKISQPKKLLLHHVSQSKTIVDMQNAEISSILLGILRRPLKAVAAIETENRF